MEVTNQKDTDMPSLSLADRTIAELRREHDALKALTAPLDRAALDAQSGASLWAIEDVLAHLGGLADVTLARLSSVKPSIATIPGASAALGAWDSNGPVQRRDQFIQRDAALM